MHSSPLILIFLAMLAQVWSVNILFMCCLCDLSYIFATLPPNVPFRTNVYGLSSPHFYVTAAEMKLKSKLETKPSP